MQKVEQIFFMIRYALICRRIKWDNLLSRKFPGIEIEIAYFPNCCTSFFYIKTYMVSLVIFCLFVSMYKNDTVNRRTECSEMSRDEYSHRLLFLIHIMNNLFSVCNSKWKMILFLKTLYFFLFFHHVTTFTMLLLSLLEIYKSTITLLVS